MLTVSRRLARPERLGPDSNTTRRRRRRRRRRVAETPGGEHHAELDSGRPGPEEGGEPVEPETGVGPAALADRRNSVPVRDGHGWGRRFFVPEVAAPIAGADDGAGAVRDGGHVRREQGRRRNAREGGGHARGGHGREAPEWDGELGGSGERHGRRDEEEGREVYGGEREVRGVLGVEEREKREKAEERESS